MLTLKLTATGSDRTAILDWLDQVKHCLNDGLDADSGRGDGDFTYTLTVEPTDYAALAHDTPADQRKADRDEHNARNRRSR